MSTGRAIAGVARYKFQMTAKREPTRRDLGDRNMARSFTALIFEELCQNTHVSTAELMRRIRRQLRRRLSRQTLAAWRRGDQAVPAEVMFVVAWIAGVKVSDGSVSAAMKALADPDADPSFVEMLRRYYGPDRSWESRAPD